MCSHNLSRYIFYMYVILVLQEQNIKSTQNLRLNYYFCLQKIVSVISRFQMKLMTFQTGDNSSTRRQRRY